MTGVPSAESLRRMAQFWELVDRVSERLKLDRMNARSQVSTTMSDPIAWMTDQEIERRAVDEAAQAVRSIQAPP